MHQRKSLRLFCAIYFIFKEIMNLTWKKNLKVICAADCRRLAALYEAYVKWSALFPKYGQLLISSGKGQQFWFFPAGFIPGQQPFISVIPSSKYGQSIVHSPGPAPLIALTKFLVLSVVAAVGFSSFHSAPATWSVSAGWALVCCSSC